MAEVASDRVLVTGASGIVGRAALDRLRQEGWAAIPIVSSSALHAPDGAIVADLSDVMPPVAPCPYVIHLAAALSHDPRYRDAEVSGQMTRQIDEVVLRAAASWNAKILYASTCSLYVPVGATPKQETDQILRVDTPYRRAKHQTELELLDEGQHLVFRLSAPYGPGMFASTVLPRFIDTARQGREIEVWGSGAREQNFVHASDVADFIARALMRNAKGLYNVAGEPITMSKLAETVIGVLGRGTCRMSGRADPLDGQTARYATEAAQADLGWRATVQLEAGIQQCKDHEFR